MSGSQSSVMVASAGSVDPIPPDQSAKDHSDFGHSAQCAKSGGGISSAPLHVSSKVDKTLEIASRVIDGGSAAAPDDGEDANIACDALFAAGVAAHKRAARRKIFALPMFGCQKLPNFCKRKIYLQRKFICEFRNSFCSSTCLESFW